MISLEFQEIVDAISNACTFEEIHTCCSTLCKQLGFDHFIYGVRIPTSFVKPQTYVLSGYTSEWRERYAAQGYLNVDPTVSYCANNLMPFNWVNIKPIEKKNDAVRMFMDESRDFGLKSGISFPIHDAKGERALLSLVSGKEHDGMQKRILETSLYAQVFSFHIHEAVKRVMRSTETYSDNVQLSVRETECLLWSAEGKTSWETSKILGISERTVIFHLQSVSEKLQVSNRLQAVARAVALGLISPIF